MKKISRYTGGFTLIELLVVIAIIGILSSVVLVSLNSARNKAKDARVQADVSQIRTALESGFNGSAYPDLNNGYTVPTNANLVSGCVVAQWNNSNASGQYNAISNEINDACNQGGIISFNTGANNSSYAIYGRLVSNTSAFFCIDSTGRTNQAATASTTATCP